MSGMKAFLAAVAMIMLSGCNSCLGDGSVTTSGIYEGILPAADGPGIKTTLTLFPDSSFREHSEYLGRKGGVFDETGTYTLKGDLITLHLGGGERNYYRLENNQIRRLTMEAQPVTGAMAEYYVLVRTTEGN